MMRHIALVVALLTLCSARGWAQDASVAARDAYATGSRQYERGEYAAAEASYGSAFEHDARPEYLYAWAQATRSRGDCPAALVLYRRFLQMAPPAAHVAAARMNMSRCVEQEPVAVVARPEPPSPARSVAPWYRDALGGELSGGGLALVAMGGGFLGGSGLQRDAATGTATYGESERHYDLSDRFRVVGIVGLSTGSVLMLAGVIRYATHGRR